MQASGVAALNGLSPVIGVYLIEIRKAGYAPKQVRIGVDAGSEFLVALTPKPLGSVAELPAVITTAKQSIYKDDGLRDGFFHRCELGVKCLGRKDFDMRPIESVPEQLSRVPGIRSACIHPYATGGMKGAGDIRQNSIGYSGSCGIRMRAAIRDHGISYCSPAWFLNGLPTIAPPPPTTQIAGMEVYLTNDPTPARYRVPPTGGPSCGAIVVWTR